VPTTTEHDARIAKVTFASIPIHDVDKVEKTDRAGRPPRPPGEAIPAVTNSNPVFTPNRVSKSRRAISTRIRIEP
jgi:hypothetical protein